MYLTPNKFREHGSYQMEAKILTQVEVTNEFIKKM